VTPKAPSKNPSPEILDAAASAAQVLRVIPRTMRHIRNELRTFAKSELTVPQFRILIHLSEHETLNNRQLAEIHGVSVAAMSRMADGLVRRGLVERSTSPTDRRQISLRLTAPGRVMLDRIQAGVRNGLAQRLTQLETQPRHELTSGLRILEEIFR
jgi:DNA-binding MarR family transcriptional regulator